MKTGRFYPAARRSRSISGPFLGVETLAVCDFQRLDAARRHRPL